MTVFIHVEEPSIKDALDVLMPRLLDARAVTLNIIDHGSKPQLLRNLPNRLAGYARRLVREDIRVLVVIDRDDDDCLQLKQQLEAIAAAVGLATKTVPDADGNFRVVNRIVVEELEAWFFGDVPALCAAYPGVPDTLARKSRYRDPDAIVGGTWEKLLQILQQAGHYRASERLPKTEVARRVAVLMNPRQNRSASFNHFVTGLEALLA